MHNKFCIIDFNTLITGSFNWTYNAQNHFENILIIRNDYEVIKGYLHEFFDLKEYFIGHTLSLKQNCHISKCRSFSFNIGILGQEQGQYEESIVQIYNICITSKGEIKHVNFLYEEYYQYLHNYLELKDENFWSYDEYQISSVEELLQEFNKERKKQEEITKFFNNTSSQNNKIYSVGIVSYENYNAHIEYGEYLEKKIDIIWKHTYFRKRIPDNIFEYEHDSITKIILKAEGY